MTQYWASLLGGLAGAVVIIYIMGLTLYLRRKKQKKQLKPLGSGNTIEESMSQYATQTASAMAANSTVTLVNNNTG